MVRRVDPIREQSVLFGEQRQQAQAEYDQTVAELRRLDAALSELSHRRQQLAGTARQQRRRLWPNYSRRGRQPLPDGSEALPPVRRNAIRLWGRRLRSVCLRLLRAHGQPVALSELHALIHHRGFAIESRHPVKALADALGYETTQGRARRTARGIYQLIPTKLPAPGRHGNPSELAA